MSAGVLLYRTVPDLEVLIAHPGGPFWKHRDDGAWSIPKGEPRGREDLFDAARREFTEETGLALPAEGFRPLGSVVLRSGKRVHAWGRRGDADPGRLVSNMFTMEWPPGSGRTAEFPEMDRFMWASPSLAETKLNRAQIAFVSRLIADIDG